MKVRPTLVHWLDPAGALRVRWAKGKSAAGHPQFSATWCDSRETKVVPAEHRKVLVSWIESKMDRG